MSLLLFSCVFIKATLAKINVLREIFVKIMRGQMSTHAIPLGGKCPYMPIFIGGGGANVRGGGHMSLHQSTLDNIFEKLFVPSCQFLYRGKGLVGSCPTLFQNHPLISDINF